MQKQMKGSAGLTYMDESWEGPRRGIKALKRVLLDERVHGIGSRT